MGSGRAGWGKSPQGFGVSEGSQPVQGREEQCHVTLMGTVGSGSGTAPFACCQGGGTDQDESAVGLLLCSLYGSGGETEVPVTPEIVNTEARPDSSSRFCPALKDLPAVGSWLLSMQHLVVEAEINSHYPRRVRTTLRENISGTVGVNSIPGPTHSMAAAHPLVTVTDILRHYYPVSPPKWHFLFLLSVRGGTTLSRGG